MARRMRIAVLALAGAALCQAQDRSELRFCVRSDPKTLDPLLAEEEVSEAIRFLTGGVLIRFNRQTQRLDPELAASWKVSPDGKTVDFELRPKLQFSDGSPFGPSDVVATIKRLMTPGLQSGIAEAFRAAGGDVRAEATGPNHVRVLFSSHVAGLELLFDELAISSSRGIPPEKAVLGPFVVAEHRSGQYVLLRRNPNYWKIDAGGKRLPNVDAVRLDIQANREVELLRFRRGELHLVDKLEPDAFERLAKDSPGAAGDLGPSLDAEFLWFNQHAQSSMPAFKTRWFQSTLFRRAMSAAINRADLVRVVYRGHARPAAGPISPSNKLWFNSAIAPQRFDPQLALSLLKQDGFRLEGGLLKDSAGNAVEWSLITNAGSKTRTQIGAMIQQDLRKIGVRVNFTPMDFQSLVERITQTNAYEACLLGLTNVELDPNSQMNVWLSSGTHHAWNPRQARPATEWEAEIDRLMQLQHESSSAAERKRAFDRVQVIAAEQQPILYLVHPDVLTAISPAVRGAAPSVLPPHLFWNVENLSVIHAPARRGY